MKVKFTVQVGEYGKTNVYVLVQAVLSFLKVKCEWVVVIRATWRSHTETRTCLLCTAETDHLLLWLHNAPNHAESRRSSYSPVVSTATTTVMDTVEDI